MKLEMTFPEEVWTDLCAVAQVQGLTPAQFAAQTVAQSILNQMEMDEVRERILRENAPRQASADATL